MDTCIDPYSNTETKKKKNRKFQPIPNSDDYRIDPEQLSKDGRTTIMIRNIPNKYTQDMLLKLIDEHFKDTYDFFYLPMDFDNQCNVGYAFINFIEPTYICMFYETFHNTRFPMFKSDKICEIVFARIQGKKDCEEHFRDSNIMMNAVR